MKILHTSDWHIGQFKGPVVNGMNLRSQDTVKCLEYMVDVASKEKPDIVCISGDIFHQEQVGPVRYSDEMITATNIITSLAHFSKYVIVMRGTPNHDGAAQFRVLERMLLNIKNVDVVTEPRVLKTPLADIACIPGFDKQELPNKYNNGRLRWLMSPRRSQQWELFLLNKIVQNGGAVPENMYTAPVRIPAVECPSMSDNVILLTDPKNLIVVNSYTMKIRSTNTDKESIMLDKQFFVVHLDFDPVIEELDATGIMLLK